jgi:hypothetical protein
MLEERRIYLGKQEDYAKGFYTRNLLYKVWKGSRFKSAYYTFCVLTLYAVGVSTRKIFQFLGSI